MEHAAQNLASNVGQLLAAEYRQLRGVGGEIAELRDDLATMNALLRMQSEAEDGAVDHFVREWMKQLRELAYDSEDCIDLYLLRIKCRPGEGVRARARRLLATFFPRRSLAGEVRALRARALAISERHARYGVSRAAATYSWIMAHPARIIPIVGTQNTARIAELADAFKVSWSRQDWYDVLVAARGERLP